MSKTMCKWDKGRVEEDLETFKELVTPPRHACKKCGRVARSEENLCRPVSLD